MIAKKNSSTRREYLFAIRPSILGGLFSRYFYTKSTEEFLLFRREDFYTKVIRLNEGYQKGFSKSCSRDIRIARSKNYHCSTLTSCNLSVYFQMLSRFYSERGLGEPNPLTDLESLRQHLAITAVRSEDGNILILHAYLVDRDGKIARLLHSFENIDRDNKESIGSGALALANRLLTDFDMEMHRQDGIVEYDFGGYSVEGCDQKLAGINKFKDSFGGDLVRLSHYRSVFDVALESLFSFWSRLRT